MYIYIYNIAIYTYCRGKSNLSLVDFQIYSEKKEKGKVIGHFYKKKYAKKASQKLNYSDHYSILNKLI